MQAVPEDIQSADTLQQAADTTQVADTTSAVNDSLDAPSLSQALGDAGALVTEGGWDSPEAWERAFQSLESAIVGLAPRIFGALLMLVALYAGYRILRNLLRRILVRSNAVQAGVQTLALQSFRLLSIILIGISVLQVLGISLTGLIAGIGVAGIAFGFAARDTVENILSGIHILTDKAFRIGDTLIVDGIYCVVEDITLRTTRLRTPKNEVLVIPNQQMANERILNHTIAGDLRIEIPFSIAYKEHPQQAREVVLKLTEDDTRLLVKPAPSVVVVGLNDSSVDLSLWVYVENPREERQIIYYYTEAIKAALNEAGIEIPFPHIQLVQD